MDSIFEHFGHDELMSEQQQQRNPRTYPVPDQCVCYFLRTYARTLLCCSRVQCPRRGNAAPGANPEPAVRRKRSGGHDQPVQDSFCESLAALLQKNHEGKIIRDREPFRWFL